jgi:ubiquinol-cytochrome c reductase cytochrome b subunit
MLTPENVSDEHHLGYEESPFVEGDMVNFVRDSFGENVEPESREAVDKAVAEIARALAHEADWIHIRELHATNKRFQEAVLRGKELITGALAEVVPSGMSCVDCHKSHDAGEIGMAPDLTGYMSREWMIEFIKNPAAERFYGDRNDRMPAFAPHDDPRLNQLDDKTIGLIVDWLRGDWAVPDEDFMRQQVERLQEVGRNER